MSDPELTVQVVVRMTPDLLAMAKAHADANERTVAQTVRLALRRYLDHADA